MLRELLKNKKFSKIIRQFLKKPEILDVILFGSAVRGKEKPGDIDLLILYTKEIEIYEIRKELREINKNIEVTAKTYENVFSPEFFARGALLSEGFSMRYKKFVSECFNYKNLVLFKYSLKNFNKSKRMQFYYSLHGRNGKKGILEKNNCYKFSDGIIISPVENSDLITDFLEKWEIEHIKFPIIIPERAVKYTLKWFLNKR